MRILTIWRCSGTGALAVALSAALVGCSSSTGTPARASVGATGSLSGAATAIVATPATSTPVETAPSGIARQNAAYTYDLFHHCGLATVPFGGRMWRSDGVVPTPEPDPSGTVTYTGSTHGVMVLVAPDRLEFTYQGSLSSPPKTLVFVPTTATQEACA